MKKIIVIQRNDLRSNCIGSNINEIGLFKTRIKNQEIEQATLILFIDDDGKTFKVLKDRFGVVSNLLQLLGEE